MRACIRLLRYSKAIVSSKGYVINDAFVFVTGAATWFFRKRLNIKLYNRNISSKSNAAAKDIAI